MRKVLVCYSIALKTLSHSSVKMSMLKWDIARVSNIKAEHVRLTLLYPFVIIISELLQYSLYNAFYIHKTQYRTIEIQQYNGFILAAYAVSLWTNVQSSSNTSHMNNECNGRIFFYMVS